MIKKYEELVLKLQQATQDHKIEWEPTSKENEFKVSFDELAVSISIDEERPNSLFATSLTTEKIAKLKLWNKEGKKIDELRFDSATDSDYVKISSLYESVRRSYFHIDDAIDEILSKL